MRFPAGFLSAIATPGTIIPARTPPPTCLRKSRLSTVVSLLIVPVPFASFKTAPQSSARSIRGDSWSSRRRERPNHLPRGRQLGPHGTDQGFEHLLVYVAAVE